MILAYIGNLTILAFIKNVLAVFEMTVQKKSSSALRLRVDSFSTYCVIAGKSHIYAKFTQPTKSVFS